MQNTEQQTQMFGITTAELKQSVEDFYGEPYETILTKFPDFIQMRSMSEMSDAQELINLGRYEEARQTLNRAKFWAGEVQIQLRKKGGDNGNS